eukprot:GHVP01064948.1.p1 GENE.GHVP01064948.1~~GHVP01064948.1.p1  ORF type:complete len:463 (-),score=76.50 GHVP01064948.1:2593-3981(-)
MALTFWCGNPSIQQIRGELHLLSNVDIDEAKNQTLQLVVHSIPPCISPWEVLEHFLPYGLEFKTIKIMQHTDISADQESKNSSLYMLLFGGIAAVVTKTMIAEKNNRRYNAVENYKCQISAVKTYKFDKDDSLMDANDLFDKFDRPSFCPVCLEYFLEEESQPEGSDENLWDKVIVSVLCGHFFHARCLRRWCDSTCPVCRFRQFPFLNSSCAECGSNENVRMCLVCGLVGCSSLDLSKDESSIIISHSRKHHVASGHCFFLDIQSQRVWDYSTNRLVHRMIQSSISEKVVPVDKDKGEFDLKPHTKETKLWSWAREVNIQNARQLDSQREYLVNQMKQKIEEVERLNAEGVISECQSLEAEIKKLYKDLDLLAQEKIVLSQKLNTLGLEIEEIATRRNLVLSFFDTSPSDNSDEKPKIRELNKLLDLKKKEIDDLRETLRDMNAHDATSNSKQYQVSVEDQ